MNKKEFVEKLSEKTDLTAGQAEDALNAVFGCIREVMIEKDTINIPGFGTFGSKLRAARAGRNPSTGEAIQIPEATVPFFKAGTPLKEAVNN